jgi:hypothetical protein
LKTTPGRNPWNQIKLLFICGLKYIPAPGWVWIGMDFIPHIEYEPSRHFTFFGNLYEALKNGMTLLRAIHQQNKKRAIEAALFLFQYGEY